MDDDFCKVEAEVEVEVLLSSVYISPLSLKFAPPRDPSIPASATELTPSVNPRNSWRSYKLKHREHMAVDIAGKVAWVRSHPMVPVAVLCSSVVLLIPRVQSVLMFFWPLLVSTALMFVTALLALGKAHLDEEDHHRHLVDEIGECSFHQQQEEDVVADEPDRSLLACVAEQHEGGIIHFDSMFQPLPSPSSGVEVNHKASMVGIEDQRDDKHINLNNKVADDSVGEMVVANAQEDKSEIIPAAQEAS